MFCPFLRFECANVTRRWIFRSCLELVFILYYITCFFLCLSLSSFDHGCKTHMAGSALLLWFFKWPKAESTPDRTTFLKLLGPKFSFIETDKLFLCLSDVISVYKHECMNSVGHIIFLQITVFILSNLSHLRIFCHVLRKQKSVQNIYTHTLNILLLLFLDYLILFSLYYSIGNNLDCVTVTEFSSQDVMSCLVHVLPPKWSPYCPSWNPIPEDLWEWHLGLVLT